jgi:hypothetical protein
MIMPKNKMTNSKDMQTRIRTTKRLTSREVLLTLCLLAGAVHGAQDDGGLAAFLAESAAMGDQQQPQVEQRWICQWCAGDNHPVAPRCALCSTPKHWTCQAQLPERVRAGVRLNAGACHFQNSQQLDDRQTERTICEMCDAPKFGDDGEQFTGEHAGPEDAPVEEYKEEAGHTLGSLPGKLNGLGFFADRDNEPRGNNPEPKTDLNINIEGFAWVDSGVHFPAACAVNPADLRELHKYNIFRVCQLQTEEKTGPVGDVLELVDPNWEAKVFPAPGDAQIVPPTGMADHLRTRYLALTNGGQSTPEVTVYNRDLEDNAKYLGAQEPAQGSKITFLTFNMLDQGLAGEGGGFRTNWNTEHDDSDSGDDHYQNVIDKPQGHVVIDEQRQQVSYDKNDPTKLSPRYERALTIILEQEPDIVTVQECDRSAAFALFLENAGYGYKFNEKTASAATRGGKTYRDANGIEESQHMDNVGIFWNKRTFEEFYGPRKIFLPNSKKGKDAEFGALEGMGKQAAMWMLLRNRTTGRLTAVVTAHQKSGKEKGEDKLVKRTQADRMAEILRLELGPNVPIIFGCDFNNGTETESYGDFRRQVPFMAEAYEDTYGMSPTWGSSKWRSGGDQTEKIGFTPNNIDFVLYSRRFFKPLGVLAYPNWEDEPLEKCNLPGRKYPSDHFAHMAVFEERNVSHEEALVEEMYHLVKRNHVTPAHNQEIRDNAGKLERMDYRFYFPNKVSNPIPEGITNADILATFYKYRTYLRPENEPLWETMEDQDDVVFSPEAIMPADLGHFNHVAGADRVDFGVYCREVKEQACRMNKHNQKRCDMEKEGAVYRTYTVLKHFILCENKANLVGVRDGRVDLACTVDTLMAAHKAKFGKGKVKMYKKFDKLPITEAEMRENLDAAKALWVTKFVQKSKNKGHFAPKRAEWGLQHRNYELRHEELLTLPEPVLLGVFADAIWQKEAQKGELIRGILQGLSQQPRAPQRAPVVQNEEQKEDGNDIRRRLMGQ